MMSQSTDQEAPPQQTEQRTPAIPPARERAEFLVDQFGLQLGQWVNTLGNGLQRFWARTREEGEDIWAEAQDIRRRNPIGIGPAGQAAMNGSASNAAMGQPQADESRESVTEA